MTLYCDIPEDVLVNVIAPFLAKSDRYEVFSTCHYFAKHITRLRCFRFTSQSWIRFCENEKFRTLILRLTGCTDEYASRRKRFDTLFLVVKLSSQQIQMLTEYATSFTCVIDISESRQNKHLLQGIQGLPLFISKYTGEYQIITHIHNLYCLEHALIDETKGILNYC